jgi:hypothetical protein
MDECSPGELLALALDGFFDDFVSEEFAVIEVQLPMATKDTPTPMCLLNKTHY